MSIDIGISGRWRVMRACAQGAACALWLAGCTTPVEPPPADDLASACIAADRRGDLPAAELACERALLDADRAGRSAELRSHWRYALGRIKRQRGGFAEAEDLLKQSLALEAGLSASADPKIGRRLVELSAALAAQNKWSEGALYLERALAAADALTGGERGFAATAFAEYANYLRGAGQQRLAVRFETQSARLR